MLRMLQQCLLFLRRMRRNPIARSPQSPKHSPVTQSQSGVGDPPELFGPKIPVVLEGSFAANGKKFESDQILVRHDSTYDEKNKDRVRQANQDAKQRASG